MQKPAIFFQCIAIIFLVNIIILSSCKGSKRVQQNTPQLRKGDVRVKQYKKDNTELMPLNMRQFVVESMR